MFVTNKRTKFITNLLNNKYMKLIETYYVKKDCTKTVWIVVDKYESDILIEYYLNQLDILHFYKKLNGTVTIKKLNGLVNKIFFTDIEKQNKTKLEFIF